MIDWNRVIVLRDEVGAEEFEPVLDLFIDEVEHLVMQLCKDDLDQLERYMHFLKGSALNLGFAEFGARCQEIETLASRGDVSGVCIEALVECYARSKQIFMRDLLAVTGPMTGDEVGVA